MPELKAAIVPVTPFQQNCTILWEEPSKRAVVIDPGGEVPRILEAIAKLGVRVERILLTHGHIDHAGGAAALKEALEQAASAEGGPVIAPLAEDGAAMNPGTEASPAVNRPGSATIPIEGPDQRDRFLLQGLETQAPTFGMLGVRNVLPDCWLVEGDEVRVGGQSFQVLHCPGHTPGHVVFVNQAARFAIVGDVLFSGSVGRTDFPYGDHAALIHAIRTKLLPLGDDFSFICGHGPGSTIGAERRANPFVRG
jgi:glyoxylase-like metal-dependent hydrolase (beta-lactamase superfamily II)